VRSGAEELTYYLNLVIPKPRLNLIAWCVGSRLQTLIDLEVDLDLGTRLHPNMAICEKLVRSGKFDELGHPRAHVTAITALKYQTTGIRNQQRFF
jgi:hypothetical protein